MVVELGADALGFVFAPSPRQISPDKVRNITKRLPPFVTPVGVFVDEEIKKVLDIASYMGLKAVQLHGSETPAYVECLCGFLDSPSLEGRGKGEGDIRPHPILSHQGGGNFFSRQFWVIKAIRVRTKRDLLKLRNYRANAYLLDSYEKGRPGGTGKTLPWGLVRSALGGRGPGPIILAGGLNPENVRAAICAVRPYGVDVSSGVESSPGKKDRQLVREFIMAAKSYTNPPKASA